MEPGGFSAVFNPSSVVTCAESRRPPTPGGICGRYSRSDDTLVSDLAETLDVRYDSLMAHTTRKQRCTFCLLLLLVSSVCFGAAAACCAEAPKAGAIVFTADFEAADALGAWSGRSAAVRLDAGFKSTRAVLIESTDAARGGRVEIALPAKRLRGCKLILAADVRAGNVSRKPASWNGIKFMAPITGASGGKSWPQAQLGVGTFGWRRVAWHAVVPKDTERMVLHLGLERVTGKVWFDNITVAVRRPPVARKPRKAAGPVYRGHSLPRLRGAMVSPRATADDLRTFGRDWKANVIRWQLFGFKPRFDTGDLKEYNARLTEELKKLDAAVKVCQEVGLMVVVDLHTGPGHWASGQRGLFANAACQKRFVEIWEHIARRYKGVKCVWGYDLLNEPLENSVAEGMADWQDLAERAARAIRKIDATRAIIIEPAPWGGPEALEQLQPIDVPNVVYSVHMYRPHPFTHQGVHNRADKPLRYPGVIGGRTWDKAALAAALKPVIDFQEAHGVHIFLGEFSAIRWAPDGSAHRYIRDCIELFEKHRWDWTYHAFREWSGWSVEHTADRADERPAKQPTARQKLLLEWFARNRKPARPR